MSCKDCRIIHHIREESRIEKDILNLKHKQEVKELKERLEIVTKLLESELR